MGLMKARLVGFSKLWRATRADPIGGKEFVTRFVVEESRQRAMATDGHLFAMVPAEVPPGFGDMAFARNLGHEAELLAGANRTPETAEIIGELGFPIDHALYGWHLPKRVDDFITDEFEVDRPHRLVVNGAKLRTALEILALDPEQTVTIEFGEKDKSILIRRLRGGNVDDPKFRQRGPWVVLMPVIELDVPPVLKTDKAGE